MKFWFTIVLGIVVTSAFVTWLTLKMGAQVDIIVPTAETISPSDSKIAMILGDKQREGEFAVETDAGDSPIEQDRSAEFRFRNDGKEPLILQLTSYSCRCMKELSVDGKVLKREEAANPVAPGKEGVIKIIWHATQKELTEGSDTSPNRRFSAEFFTNSRTRNQIRLEIKTRIVPQETKRTS